MRLTLPQEDVYFEQLIFPEDPIYNIGAKIAIDGQIDYDLLDKAYRKLINQHDAYRSIVCQNSDDVYIKFVPEYNGSLDFVDFSESKNPDDDANKFMHKIFKTPFIFEKEEQLHRFTLIKIRDTFYYLFSMYHHIITDGWGTSLMFQRLVNNYNELVRCGTITTVYSYSYADFVQDDLEYTASDNYEKDRIYWLERFQELPDSLFMEKSKKKKSNCSKREELLIKRSLYNQLEGLSKELGSNTFHFILATLFLYFGVKHQKKDFAIGLPVLNRSKAKYKKTVGLFMGVSAFRIAFDVNDTFRTLIQNIKKQLRQDYRYQRFPLGKIVKELNVFREKERLFNITLSYEKQDYSSHFENTNTKVLPLTHESERVALAIYIREFDTTQDIKIDFDYNLNYFTGKEIKRVKNHLRELFLNILKDPDRKLFCYEYITASEKKQLLQKFNKPINVNFEAKTIFSYLSYQSKIEPNKEILFDAYKSYSYTDLEETVNYIAFRLNCLDIPHGAPIGIHLERSADLIVLILGIMRSGHPYIPLDPDFPIDRIRYIVEHSEVALLISNSEPVLLNLNLKFVTADELLNKSIKVSKLPELINSDSAYILYTSGSTGKPKGVEVSHKSLLNFLLSMQVEPGIQPKDVLYSVTTQSFDISILEFLLPLISGAKLYVANKAILKDPLKIIENLKVVNPTIIQGTPSFYQMLFNANWEGNSELKILCGGDLLSQNLAERLLHSCLEVWNLYGPTETTIWSSIKKISHKKDANNIGHPIANTQCYLLNEYGNLVPIGVEGILHIAGEGLAKGYYNAPKTTSQKFVENPFKTDSLMYNTGDIARWNTRGELEFLGRNDFQVKIRGYRVELSEIENTLNTFEMISESVVSVRRQGNQEAFLVAYVTTNLRMFYPNQIIRELQARLPDYMVPMTIIPLDSLPLTANKKVDRTALSRLEIIKPNLSINARERSQTQLQKTLSSYFQEILQLKALINTNESFFSLGGHSLNAVRLLSRIKKDLNFELNLKDIFDNPTVAQLSCFLEGYAPESSFGIARAEKRTHYPLTPSQRLIWVAAQNASKSIAYNMNGFYKIEGEIDIQLLEKATARLLKKYDILRSNFTEIQGEPYMIISKSQQRFTIDKHKVEISEVDELLDSFIHSEFILEKDFLLRIAYLRVDENCKYLVFSTHHIISDGWSIEIFVKEIFDAYNSLSTTTDEYIPSRLPFQYQDYVMWQQKRMKASEAQNVIFWNNYLKDYQWPPLYPSRTKISNDNFNAGEYSFKWHDSLLRRLVAASSNYNCSLHSLLISTFSLLLAKFFKYEEICIGTLNSGRGFADLENQIGMFVKTLPLVTKIHSDMIILDLVKNVNSDILALDRFQDIPPSILKHFRPDILFVLQTYNYTQDRIKVNNKLQLKKQSLQNKFCRLPLLINLEHVENAIIGSMIFDKKLWKSSLIKTLAKEYESFLLKFISSPQALVKEIQFDFQERDNSLQIPLSF